MSYKKTLLSFVVFALGCLVSFALFYIMARNEDEIYYFMAIFGLLLFVSLFVAIKRKLPGGFVVSFSLTGIIMSIIWLWGNLTIGAECYRNVRMNLNGEAKSSVLVDRHSVVLDTHSLFSKAIVVNKVNERDSILFLNFYQYLLGKTCRASVEMATKKVIFYRDTSRIYSPWHGYKVYCDELIGGDYVALSKHDSVIAYSNAVYFTRMSPSKKYKHTEVYSGDTIYFLSYALGGVDD